METTIKIIPSSGTPATKLAEAEVHFDGGLLSGLKLTGFAVWERRGGAGRNVTFPAKQYAVNGERRAFALLRPIEHATAQNTIRDAILAAYEAQEEGDCAPTCASRVPFGECTCGRVDRQLAKETA